MNYRLLFVFVLFFSIHIKFSAQKIPDTLLQKSNEELLKAYGSFKKIDKKEIYLKAYLKKAKISNDTVSLVNAYTYFSDLYLYSSEKRIQYSDSIIQLTKKNPDPFYPASAYIVKGHEYFTLRKIKLALDNYLIAKEYALKYDNKDFFWDCNNTIGILKDRIGYSEEALQIHKQNLKFAKKNYTESTKSYPTTASIHAIAFTYKNLEKLDSALYYNNIGIEKAKNFNFYLLTNLLLLNEGIIYYHKKKVIKSKISIEKAVKHFEKEEDKPNMAESYFYLAKIYKDLNQEDKAIKYLKKVDAIFIQTNDLLPEIREGYEILIEYYKKKENTESQLLYLERLISLDSVLSSNKSYLADNLKSKYDIPKLIEAKEVLIAKLENDKSTLKYIFIAISIILMLTIFGLYRRQQKFKQKFNAIIDKDVKVVTEHPTVKSIDITNDFEVPQYIADDILKQLEIFESKQEYIDNKITLLSLAKSCKTNSTYLSKTINHYHNKSFTNYINDLRVTYALEKLKDDSSFRRYTIKAIAHDTGFKSAETFSKLFKKKNGIYPSYFIKQMDALQKQNSM